MKNDSDDVQKSSCNLSLFTCYSSLLLDFDSAVCDGEHDAVFACVFERDGMVRGAGFVDYVIARAMDARVVPIAALKKINLFESAMAMRGIGAARLHADENGRVAARFILTEHVQMDAPVPRRTPVDVCVIEHVEAGGDRRLLAWLSASRIVAKSSPALINCFNLDCYGQRFR